MSKSGKGLVKPLAPLSPMGKIPKADLLLRANLLISLIILELTEPHKPLSEVKGTRRVVLTVGVYFFFWTYDSLSNIFWTLPKAKFLPLSNLLVSAFILDAATIFMALVIFLIEPMAFILIFNYFKLAPKFI